MVSSDFRAKAREKLAGKWGKAALMMLCYFAYALVINYLTEHTTGFLAFAISIASLVINVPIAYGLTMAYLKLYNDEEVGYFDFFTLGFENFSRAWSVAWNVFLKLLVPFIVVCVAYFLIGIGAGYAAASSSSSGANVIAVIGALLSIGAGIWLACQSFYYELAQYVAIDNPSMSGKETAEESKRLMEGKRGKLFCLMLSFIGWAILACITLGIGYLWLAPYMLFATIAFYKFTLGDTTKAEAPVETPVEEVSEEKAEDVQE